MNPVEERTIRTPGKAPISIRAREYGGVRVQQGTKGIWLSASECALLARILIDLGQPKGEQ